MRTFRFFVAAALSLSMMVACNSSSIVKKASGLPYEVLVVMDSEAWQGGAGHAIKKDLRSPVPALTQVEPAMKVSYVKPIQFDGMMTYVRNIVEVKIDPTMYTKVTLAQEPNKWAQNQKVLTLKAPDTTAIMSYMAKRPEVLANYFSEAERDRYIELLQKTYSTKVKEKVEAMFGVELRMPSDMNSFKEGTDFLWASNNANSGMTNMVMYSFPYTDVKNFSQEYLVAKRDSVLKANLPGSFAGSYMTTEKRFMLSYEVGEQDHAYLAVVRGLWKMHGDMMGGPFVSHFVLDEARQRILAVEGFVYAPERNKANFIRRVEAALYTLRLP